MDIIPSGIQAVLSSDVCLQLVGAPPLCYAEVRASISLLWNHGMLPEQSAPFLALKFGTATISRLVSVAIPFAFLPFPLQRVLLVSCAFGLSVT